MSRWKPSTHGSGARLDLRNGISATVHKSCAQGTVCFSWRRNARPFFLLEG